MRFYIYQIIHHGVLLGVCLSFWLIPHSSCCLSLHSFVLSLEMAALSKREECVYMAKLCEQCERYDGTFAMDLNIPVCRNGKSYEGCLGNWG